jgi:hypothetical protein
MLADSNIPGYKVTTCSLTFLSRKPLRVVTVPNGYHTDGYSLPLGVLFSQWDNPAPAVLHDWLYSYPDGMTRSECDAMFLDSMKASGVGLVKRWLFYAAVRMFGSRSWNLCRAEDENEKFYVDRALGSR